MNTSDKQNLTRALAAIIAQEPDSFPAAVEIANKEIGAPAVDSLLNSSLLDVLGNLTLADIAAIANGAKS